MTNSRAKGARGEREFATFLRGHGIQARRGQQFKGTEDSPDVATELDDWLHFEVKRTEKFSAYKAMAQAQEDAGDKVPVVAHRRNRREWLVVMRAEDWVEMVKDSMDPRDIEDLIACPQPTVIASYRLTKTAEEADRG